MTSVIKPKISARSLGLIRKESMGCSRKVPADLLRNLQDEGLLGQVWEDAAPISIGGQTLLASVDLIHLPCDDLRAAGEIAVNHCANDIYAKGGTPLFALSIVMYPPELDATGFGFLREVATGIKEGCARIGATVVGGHSVYNEDCLFGLALLGRIHESRNYVPKTGVQLGDKLVLTKALGALYALYACESGDDPLDATDAALQSMLHGHVEPCAGGYPNACTDISGFGLVGHLQEMIHGTSLGVRLTQLPSTFSSDRSKTLAPMCAMERNYQSYAHLLRGPRFPSMDPRLFAPETSGPLLLSVPGEHASECLERLRASGFARAAIVGEVVSETGIALDL